MKLNTQSLADVQLGTPLLAEGIYFVRIRPKDGVKVEENKAKDGQVLKLSMQILNEQVTTYEDSKVLNNEKQFMVLWSNISLATTYAEDGTTVKYDPSVRLKELGIAIGLPEDFDDLDTTDLEGKCLKVQVKHRPAKDGYNAQNEVSRYLVIKDEDDFVVPAFSA